MTVSQLREIFKSNVLIMGTTEGVEEEGLLDLVQAGTHILLTPPCEEMDAAEIAAFEKVLKAAGDRAFVAGQITAPEDVLEESGGFLSYEEYYEQVLSQAQFIEDMGAALIVLTGFKDILTAKCALYAIAEGTDLPVCAGFTVPEEGGLARALSMLITLQALGVCAVGCTGMNPDATLDLLLELQAFATVPLFAITEEERGLAPEAYGDYVASYVNQKCTMVAIKTERPAFCVAAAKALWQLSPIRPDFPLLNAICSQDVAMFLDFKGNVISQTKQMIEIKTEELDEIEQAIELFNRAGAAPVCFHIKDLDVLEYAITRYAGRPAVRSDEYGKITAKELGAMILEPESE